MPDAPQDNGLFIEVPVEMEGGRHPTMMSLSVLPIGTQLILPVGVERIDHKRLPSDACKLANWIAQQHACAN
jgi:hypothetical protein